MESVILIPLLCISTSCGFVFLYVAGISFIDSLTYTEFFDELQKTLGIDPPRINVKNQLWLHRIFAIMVLMLSTLACVFSAWQLFVMSN